QAGQGAAEVLTQTGRAGVEAATASLEAAEATAKALGDAAEGFTVAAQTAVGAAQGIVDAKTAEFVHATATQALMAQTSPAGVVGIVAKDAARVGVILVQSPDR
ncbi:MAG: hypothetical protein AB8U48_03320, partial [Anaplasma ovis]